MKKIALLLLAALPLFSLSANAAPTTRTYTCRLSGDMQGLNIAFGLGGEYIGGNGLLACVNNHSQKTVRIPVRLSLVGGGGGFEVSVIRDLHVVTAGVSVDNPNYFFRTFGVGATVGGTLINSGVEFDTAFRVNAGGTSGGFEVGLQGRDAVGLGVHLYGMGFEVEAL